MCQGRRRTLAHKYTPTACFHHLDIATESDGVTLKQACFQGCPKSALHIQVSIGSRNSAIHNAYRSSLRPSSLLKPRHPSLTVCGAWRVANTPAQEHRGEAHGQGTWRRGLEGGARHPARPRHPGGPAWGQHITPSPDRVSRQELTTPVQDVCE